MTALALATFETEGTFVRARLHAIADERRIVGEWTPYASAALSGAAGTRGIVPAMVAAGVLGLAGLFALEWWSTAVVYPFPDGGRPLFSWPAFIPAVVEVGALVAAFAGVIVFGWRARLTRLHHPAFDFDEVLAASQGAFVLAIACDAGADAAALIAALARAGAAHTRVVTP